MGPGMMQGGMGAMFGSRVTPMMNLSAEDVRGYLGAQLARLDNKRLKVGDIKAERDHHRRHRDGRQFARAAAQGRPAYWLH